MKQTQTIKIQGKQVYLVPFAENHLNDSNYLHWLRDYEVMKYIGREEYLEPIPFLEVKTYVDDMWNSKYISFWALHNIADDAFIGTAKINYMNEQGLSTKCADIGIMIGDRKAWGKGMATDTLFALCNYAFHDLGVRKLTAGAMSPNLAVIKAFKKIGFVEEGRLRGKILLGNIYLDHVLLGCFKSELITANKEG